jgi:hypothetical protein
MGKHMDEFAVKNAAKATWLRDPAIRMEFTTYEAYEVYEIASAKGLVHMCGKEAVQTHEGSTARHTSSKGAHNV